MYPGLARFKVLRTGVQTHTNTVIAKLSVNYRTLNRNESPVRDCTTGQFSGVVSVNFRTSFSFLRLGRTSQGTADAKKEDDMDRKSLCLPNLWTSIFDLCSWKTRDNEKR
jgi:hypothetical protein